MRYLLLIPITLFLLSCNSQSNKNTVKHNEIIKKYFSKTEIELLNGLITYCNNEFFKDEKEFFKDFKSFIEKEDSIFFIENYDIKRERIFSKIDTLLFNKIWIIEEGYVKQYDKNTLESYPIDTLQNLSLNPSGDYLQVLKNY